MDIRSVEDILLESKFYESLSIGSNNGSYLYKTILEFFPEIAQHFSGVDTMYNSFDSGTSCKKIIVHDDNNNDYLMKIDFSGEYAEIKKLAKD